jgi:hypothetical protein
MCQRELRPTHRNLIDKPNISQHPTALAVPAASRKAHASLRLQTLFQSLQARQGFPCSVVKKDFVGLIRVLRI